MCLQNGVISVTFRINDYFFQIKIRQFNNSDWWSLPCFIISNTCPVICKYQNKWFRGNIKDSITVITTTRECMPRPEMNIMREFSLSTGDYWDTLCSRTVLRVCNINFLDCYFWNVEQTRSHTICVHCYTHINFIVHYKCSLYSGKYYT